MNMEFVVVDDDDDSVSEFNYGSRASDSDRVLIDKIRNSLGFSEDSDDSVMENSLNRRNTNRDRETNEVRAGTTRERRLPLQKLASRSRARPRTRNTDQERDRWQNDDDNDGGSPASGMTRRCACNLSQCASTNYMCKSERRVTGRAEDGTEIYTEAGCFIEELDPSTLEALTSNGGVGLTEANGKVTSARRGCIENLSKEKFKHCSDLPGAPVHCCFDEDMCNYPKTFYPPQIHSHLNHNRISFDSQNGSLSPNLDSQVWLRAALLTIPIFGIIILIILIVFARRMLKNDAKDKEYRTATAARSGHRRGHAHKGCTTGHHVSIQGGSPANFQPNTSNSSSCPLVRPGGSPVMPAAELHC